MGRDYNCGTSFLRDDIGLVSSCLPDDRLVHQAKIRRRPPSFITPLKRARPSLWVQEFFFSHVHTGRIYFFTTGEFSEKDWLEKEKK